MTQNGSDKTYHSSLSTVTCELILRTQLSSYKAAYQNTHTIILPGTIQGCQTHSKRVLLRHMMPKRSWVSAVQMHVAWLVVLSYRLSKNDVSIGCHTCDSLTLL